MKNIENIMSQAVWSQDKISIVPSVDADTPLRLAMQFFLMYLLRVLAYSMVKLDSSVEGLNFQTVEK
jgi:hypothetical protein